jgi:hypothetical protein
MDLVVLASVAFIVVHGVDGREVVINTRNLTTLSEARDAENPKKLLAPGVSCVLHLVDGGFVTTRETCAVISKWITGSKEFPQ